MPNISHLSVHDAAAPADHQIAKALLTLCDLMNTQNAQLGKIASEVEILRHAVNKLTEKK